MTYRVHDLSLEGGKAFADVERVMLLWALEGTFSHCTHFT